MRNEAVLPRSPAEEPSAAAELPLGVRWAPLLRWFALALTALAIGYGVIALWLWPEAIWHPHAPGAGALPALSAAPIFLLAWWATRAQRSRAAAIALFAGGVVFAVLATWPRGVFSTTWYLQPLLVLLAACCLDALPALLLTLVSVASLLAAPLATEIEGELQEMVWTHTASLAAVTLASALTGLVVHHLFARALRLAEAQRRLRQEAQRALRYRERLLRHAMRVETVGDLAGMVSHQLRNAFQVMMGHATLGAVGSDADRQRRLALLADELGNARPLLDQLMELAHPDEGAAVARDLDAEVRAFHDRAQRIMPANIQLVLSSCGRELPALVNPRGLEHALWNLVLNARHAMPEGGSITLHTEARDGTASVAVVDTGCGIPDEIRGRVFDPYFTTKPMGQGTGLGLAAVDRFVRASNGSIRLDSEVGKGTSFTLCFPLAAQRAPAEV